jgi:hypothetical protein
LCEEEENRQVRHSTTSFFSRDETLAREKLKNISYLCLGGMMLSEKDCLVQEDFETRTAFARFCVQILAKIGVDVFWIKVINKCEMLKAHVLVFIYLP